MNSTRHASTAGTSKPMIFVAASRDGQARARVVANDQRATLEPVLLEWLEPTTTTLMTDGSTSYPGMGKTMASHHRVIHSNDEYAKAPTAFGSRPCLDSTFVTK